MKATCILFLFFLPLISVAQSVNEAIYANTTIHIKNAKEAEQYIINNTPELYLGDMTISLSDEINSKAGIHYTFDVLYRNIILQNNVLKLHCNKDHELLFYKKELNDFTTLHNNSFNAEIDAFSKWNNYDILLQKEDIPKPVKNSYPCILFENEIPTITLKVDSYTEDFDSSVWINTHGEIIKQYSYLKNFKDTTIHAFAFKPDPLTSGAYTYGGLYSNHNDSNFNWLDAEQKTVTINTQFDTSNQLFLLQNRYAKIVDFELPSLAPVTSANSNFFYNRSQSGFEDCNTLYHVDNFRNIINPLGYITLFDSQLHIDAHGQFGNDNSVFNRNGGNATLSLGTGGVNDAEDADVIIHEYSHGLSWSANNNTVMTNERNGLDEGLADYFCTSYSRQLNATNWTQVFSWDGHNEFWAGRTANLIQDYSPTFSGSYYTLGEIWNTAMSRIETSIGATKANSIMLEALYYFTNNTTLPEAAMYVLHADSLLFGGADAVEICTGFKSNKIITTQCGAIATSTVQKPNDISVKNTLGFTDGSSAVVVTNNNNKDALYQLLNMQAQTILSSTISKNSTAFIHSKYLSKGLYLLKINTNNINYSFKLNRY